jgi:hypothetical protein
MLDRYNPTEIDPKEVTPDMMGHFTRPERKMIRLLLGLDAAKITDGEALRIELDLYTLQSVKAIRLNAVKKLRELMSAVKASGLFPWQIRLSSKLLEVNGFTVPPASLTPALLQECFQQSDDEFEMLDRLYMGSSGEPTVQVTELVEEYGGRARNLSKAALDRLVKYIQERNIPHSTGGTQTIPSLNGQTADDGIATSFDDGATFKAEDFLVALRELVIEPMRRVRRLEEQVRLLQEVTQRQEGELMHLYEKLAESAQLRERLPTSPDAKAE